MRGFELGIEFRGLLQLDDGFGHSSRLGVERAELIMRDGLGGRQADHLLKLSNGRGGIARFAEVDAQIKPGVGELGISPLDIFEAGDGVLSLAGTQQRQGVVQALAIGVRGEVESLFELGNGFGRSGGVFIEGRWPLILCASSRADSSPADSS